MLTGALIFAAIAALIHVYIFMLESVVFMKSGRRVFGLTAEEAQHAQLWAYNQGFYNLFLAIGTAVGIIYAWSGHHSVGVALVSFGMAAIFGAGVILYQSSQNLRGALIQAVPSGLALILLLLR